MQDIVKGDHIYLQKSRSKLIPPAPTHSSHRLHSLLRSPPHAQKHQDVCSQGDDPEQLLVVQRTRAAGYQVLIMFLVFFLLQTARFGCGDLSPLYNLGVSSYHCVVLCFGVVLPSAW